MTNQSYQPHPLESIPTLFTSEKILRYVARDHPFHWVQQGQLTLSEDRHEWVYYREPIAHLDMPERFSGISISIAQTSKPGLLILASAQEPGGYERQMGFRRSYLLQQQQNVLEDAYSNLFSQLHHLALQWLFEARLFIARMLQVTDPEERLVFERICMKEEFEDEFIGRSIFTPAHIAGWCGWYLPSNDPRHLRGRPDSTQVESYVHRLVEKQLLLEQDGEFHTPEYTIDGSSSRICTVVIPESSWLQQFAVPGVLGSLRPARSSGCTWLSALLDEPGKTRESGRTTEPDEERGTANTRGIHPEYKKHYQTRNGTLLP